MDQATNSSNIIDSCKTLQHELFIHFSSFNSQKNFPIFWEKWTTLHLNLLKYLLNDDHNIPIKELEIKESIKLFLHKRQGLISLLAQSLKVNSKNKNDYLVLNELITQHDEKFKTFLKQILDGFSTELIRVQSMRKVSAAYLHSSY